MPPRCNPHHVNRPLTQAWRVQKARLLATAFFLASLISNFRAGAADVDDDSAVVVELSERRLEKHPDDEKAWGKLTGAFIGEGDFKRADKALARWRANVSHPSPLIEKREAELAFARANFKEAVTAWKRYLTLHPDGFDDWKQYAWACSEAHDRAAGVEACTGALKIRNDADMIAQRAALRIRLHDWAGAEADLRQANKLEPTNVRVQRLLPVFDRKAEWLAVMTKLDAGIAKDPENARLRLNRAEWLVSEDLVDAAGDDIEEAQRLDPGSLRARVWSGLLAWERHEPDKAGSMLEMKINKVTQSFEAELKAMDASADHEARAQFLIRNGQPLMAVEEVRGVEGSVAKAKALFDLRRLPEAGIAARKAVEMHPKDFLAWYLLAQLELENGNLREAIDAADHSMKLKKIREAEDLRKTASQRLGRK